MTTECINEVSFFDLNQLPTDRRQQRKHIVHTSDSATSSGCLSLSTKLLLGMQERDVQSAIAGLPPWIMGLIHVSLHIAGDRENLRVSIVHGLSSNSQG